MPHELGFLVINGHRGDYVHKRCHIRFHIDLLTLHLLPMTTTHSFQHVCYCLLCAQDVWSCGLCFLASGALCFKKFMKWRSAFNFHGRIKDCAGCASAGMERLNESQKH